MVVPKDGERIDGRGWEFINKQVREGRWDSIRGRLVWVGNRLVMEAVVERRRIHGRERKKERREAEREREREREREVRPQRPPDSYILPDHVD